MSWWQTAIEVFTTMGGLKTAQTLLSGHGKAKDRDTTQQKNEAAVANPAAEPTPEQLAGAVPLNPLNTAAGGVADAAGVSPQMQDKLGLSVAPKSPREAEAEKAQADAAKKKEADEVADLKAEAELDAACGGDPSRKKADAKEAEEREKQRQEAELDEAMGKDPRNRKAEKREADDAAKRKKNLDEQAAKDLGGHKGKSMEQLDKELGGDPSILPQPPAPPAPAPAPAPESKKAPPPHNID